MAVEEQPDRLLHDAVRAGASDLHLEPGRDRFRARMRVDGTLHEVWQGPMEDFMPLINRIKVRCRMDIAERRKPQDGGFFDAIDGKKVDFRVSVVPLPEGEKAAIRILDDGRIELTPQGLGVDRALWDRVAALARRTNGLLLFTGPTGSGKSTSLYTLLQTLQNDAVHILTLEDPIEVRLDGVNQMQVNEKVGFTFSNGLRAILRQDPEIIMVGEIRDRETAEIAIRAAITGHLVLSTLHTNDSHSAVVRLLDMGIEPYLIAAALNGVVSQRLIKRLCPHCKQLHRDSGLAALLGAEKGRNTDTSWYRAQGCDRCRGGYKGRIAMLEVLAINDNLREGIVRKESDRYLRERSKDFQPMKQDGLRILDDGISDFNEVYRALSLEAF